MLLFTRCLQICSTRGRIDSVSPYFELSYLRTSPDETQAVIFDKQGGIWVADFGRKNCLTRLNSSLSLNPLQVTDLIVFQENCLAIIYSNGTNDTIYLCSYDSAEVKELVSSIDFPAKIKNVYLSRSLGTMVVNSEFTVYIFTYIESSKTMITSASLSMISEPFRVSNLTILPLGSQTTLILCGEVSEYEEEYWFYSLNEDNQIASSPWGIINSMEDPFFLPSLYVASSKLLHALDDSRLSLFGHDARNSSDNAFSTLKIVSLRFYGLAIHSGLQTEEVSKRLMRTRRRQRVLKRERKNFFITTPCTLR
eukprot:TRINITY_DN3269_c0_g2_i12.p1 TRINITY_DN3269_c0_g2~~TRINITY_DN3269_c0_g2_i12.p1  ORF type:complete len:309 (+),score=8.09 TRINITY_DN3269_c0_g2_i12:170-1096(+)